MKKLGLAPLSIQQSKIENFYLSNFVYETNDNLITNSIFTGLAADKNLSLIKSLCEFIERNAFKSGFELNLEVCNTERSDGFAAFPNFPDRRTGLNRSRTNALNEALERYVWATWWDQNTASTIEKVPITYFEEVAPIIGQISKCAPIENIFHIMPHFLDFSENYSPKLVIIFLKIKNLGYISAGAVDIESNFKTVYQRCFAELLRHSLAFNKHLTKNIQPKSLYEKRLIYFASGKGNSLIDEKLSATSTTLIRLPSLKYDRTIPHIFDDLISVHRCIYENQPPFIGGAIERLCL